MIVGLPCDLCQISYIIGGTGAIRTSVIVPASDLMNAQNGGTCLPVCTTENFPPFISFDIILRCALPQQTSLGGVPPSLITPSSSAFVPGLRELLEAGPRAPELMRTRIDSALSQPNSPIRSSLPAFSVAWAYTAANRTMDPELMVNITKAATAANNCTASGNSTRRAIDPDLVRFQNTSSLIEGLGVNVDSMLAFSYTASQPFVYVVGSSGSLDWIAAPIVLGTLGLALVAVSLVMSSRHRKQKRIVKPNPSDPRNDAPVTMHAKSDPSAAFDDTSVTMHAKSNRIGARDDTSVTVHGK
jgi:hypothetical protein